MLEPWHIVGPTGSGKSALGLRLALEHNGEIVNADAFQVYRGMEILTAQPSQEDLKKVPHLLYGIVSPSEKFDAAQYANLARAAIADIQQRGRRPIVVGGSGMYVKALTHGFADVPPVDETLRAELAAMPLEELCANLLARDPNAATHVNLRNPRHVQRALEICLLTGRAASDVKQQWNETAVVPMGIFVNPPREELYARINQRTLDMFAAGVVEEVRGLGEMSPTAAKAIGVREILAGGPTETMISAIQQATRRFAKRQVTWFKRERWQDIF